MTTIENKLKVSFGKAKEGQDFFIDFEKDKIGLTLLLGQTGSGKSVLGYYIYKQLVAQNSHDEIGFVLIDNIRIEFTHWSKNSPYLYCPNILDHNLALETLEKLADKAQDINNGQRHLFIHIEECDLFAIDSERLEKALKLLLAHKENSKIHIMFSTSRPSPEIITPWLLELTDLKIICQMASSRDYITVTGKDYSSEFSKGGAGEKIIILKDKVYHLLPLTAQETSLANDYNLGKEKEPQKNKSKFWQIF